MESLPGKPASFWIDSTPATDYPALAGNVSVDVAIVGGGITGLTAALLLTRAGKSVAVVDSKRIARGVTGYTTAKVTSSHSVIYRELVNSFGEEGARIYAESQQAALERVARLVDEEQVECDFARTSNYLYAESDQDLQTIEDEAETAARLGLPASFVRESPLPFPIAGAVRFDNQIEFHPRKYLLALAESVANAGGQIFEETRALDVEEGEPCGVVTDRGTVKARDVVLATLIPFLDRGFFFAKVHPYRSYVLCPRVQEANAPDGMFVSTESPTHTVRSSPYPGGVLLIVAGEGHKTGQEPATEERYRKLEEWIRSRFEIQSIEYRWSTQDYYSVDKVPYVGQLTRRSRHIYVATGFGAWGMTNGTLAGMLLSDAILGVENGWARLYDAKRMKPKASAQMFVKENANAGRRWIGDRLSGADSDSIAEVGRGEGRIVKLDGKKTAVYRDEQGELHVLSPVCTHLGCLVSWNTAEKTWDCPCHGSRFDADGKLVQGPAVRDLERRD